MPVSLSGGGRAPLVAFGVMFLAGLCLLVPGPAVAAPAGEEPVVQVEGSAYLRSAPWSAIVGALPDGAPLTVLEADCDGQGQPWFQVSSPGGKGWILGGLVRLNGGFAAEVALGPLRTRDAPWGLPRGLLGHGDWVRAVGAACDADGAPWYRLAGGGWAFGSYLRPADGTEPVAADALARAVTTDEVLLRTAPWGPSLGSLAAEREVVVLNSELDERGDWWHHVAYGRKRGWMHGRYLVLGPLDSSPGRSLGARLQGGSYAVLYAFEGERVARLMTARSGASWDPTPTGEFKVLGHLGTVHTTLYRRRTGHEWYLPHFIRLQGDYGIHGPMIDERTGLAAMYETAGCLMPSAANAEWLYNWLRLGDPILIR